MQTEPLPPPTPPAAMRIKRRHSGFSYVEIVTACAIFGIAATSGVSGLLKMNNNASLSRLQTGASTVAQNRIDLILSDGPFNPQKNQTPPVLALGLQSVGTPTAPAIPIYTDPTTGKVSVWGWMNTEVQDGGVTLSGQNVNVYRATVSVHYKFRGKSYNVSMCTLRASDI